MNYCETCGAPLKSGANYCTHCGNEIEVAVQKNLDFNAINSRIDLQNNQNKVAKVSRYFAVFFLILAILPFQDWSPLSGAWPLVVIFFFLFVSSVIVSFLFRSRGKKLQTLINGQNLLAHWVLTSIEKEEYVSTLYQNEFQKNKGILLVIVIISTVVFGIFILIIDEAQFTMLLVYLGLMVVLTLFALGMPAYYRNQNRKNDGLVLLGTKYAYINGYFHNWDFPLSGIRKAKIVDRPFHGLLIQYYYTDRTLTNTEELLIPAPKEIDLHKIIAQINP